MGGYLMQIQVATFLSVHRSNLPKVRYGCCEGFY